MSTTDEINNESCTLLAALIAANFKVEVEAENMENFKGAGSRIDYSSGERYMVRVCPYNYRVSKRYFAPTLLEALRKATEGE